MSGRHSKSRRKKDRKHRTPSPAVQEEKAVEEVDDRRRVTFTITVQGARGLVASAGPDAKVNSSARWYFPGWDAVSETPVMHDERNPTYDSSHMYEDIIITEAFVHSIVMSEFEINVMEHEKRSKNQVGTVVVDWMPLVQGATHIEGWFPIEAVIPDTPVSEEAERPELFVSIDLSTPMWTAEEWAASKIAKVHIDAVYSIPEKWHVHEEEGEEAEQFLYIARCSLPLSAEESHVLTFTDGVVELAPHAADAAAAMTPVAGEPPVGVLLPDQQKEVDEMKRFKRAELTGQRVRWKSSQSVFVGPSGVESLRKQAESGMTWSIEVCRVPVADKYDPNSDPNFHIYHGLCSMRLGELFEPGSTLVTARCPLNSYYNEEHGLEEVIDNALRDTTKKASRSKRHGKDKDRGAAEAKSSKTKEGHKRKSRKDDKKSKSRRKEKDASDEEDEAAAEPENAYAAAGSYVVATLAFDRPVVPRPPTPKPVYRVSDFIPQRERLPRPPQPSLPAPQAFKAEVDDVMTSLLEEYKKLYAEELLSNGGGGGGGGMGSRDSRAERQKKFVYELNVSGRYFAFKEKLKVAVVRIVREKFQTTSPFASRNEMQTFLNDLYMYLIDEMHTALNETFDAAPHVPIPKTVEDEGVLLRYASEAEINLDFDLAARHLQERIARNKDNVDYWYDYAAFCFRVDDLFKADECLREALSISDTHVPSLLAYGVLSAGKNLFDQAETLLKAATEISPGDPVVWVILSLFLDMMDREEEADTAYGRAAEIESTELELRARSLLEATDALSLPNETKPAEPKSLYIRATEFLLEIHMTSMAERALSHDLLQVGSRSVDAALCLGRHCMQVHAYEQADEFLKEVIDSAPDVERKVRAFVYAGHSAFMQEEFGRAQASFEAALKTSKDEGVEIDDLLAVYLRCGGIYLMEEEFEEAKAVYLKACQVSPTAYSWLGVGIACYKLGEYDQAEDALSEANILNNHDSNVWGYLTLVCLATDRLTEADQAITQALKLGIANSDVLNDIGTEYALKGRLTDAEQCLLRSLQVEENVVARRALADVLVALRRNEDAMESYKMVVTSGDSDLEDKRGALECLVDLVPGGEERKAVLAALGEVEAVLAGGGSIPPALGGDGEGAEEDGEGGEAAGVELKSSLNGQGGGGAEAELGYAVGDDDGSSGQEDME